MTHHALEIGAAVAPVTKPAIYTRVKLDKTAKEPDDIGKAIQIGQHF